MNERMFNVLPLNVRIISSDRERTKKKENLNHQRRTNLSVWVFSKHVAICAQRFYVVASFVFHRLFCWAHGFDATEMRTIEDENETTKKTIVYRSNRMKKHRKNCSETKSHFRRFVRCKILHLVLCAIDHFEPPILPHLNCKHDNRSAALNSCCRWSLFAFSLLHSYSSSRCRSFIVTASVQSVQSCTNCNFTRIALQVFFVPFLLFLFCYSLWTVRDVEQGKVLICNCLNYCDVVDRVCGAQMCIFEFVFFFFLFFVVVSFLIVMSSRVGPLTCGKTMDAHVVDTNTNTIAKHYRILF